MKRLLSIAALLIIVMCTGCSAYTEQTESPTPLVTKRFYDDSTATVVPTPTIALLTPKPDDSDGALDFSVVGIEVSGGKMTVAINLDGDSVDLVTGLSVKSITFENQGINFLPLTQQDISALENKYMTGIYFAVRLDSNKNGVYSFELDVILTNGSQMQVEISETIEF